jgi:stalled ribosome alternative rescue factor ArfA
LPHQPSPTIAALIICNPERKALTQRRKGKGEAQRKEKH